MALRILLSACALVLGAGCVTVESENSADNSATVARATDIESPANFSTEFLACDDGQKKEAAIDIGSAGPSLFFGCIETSSKPPNTHTLVKFVEIDEVILGDVDADTLGEVDYADELNDPASYATCYVGSLFEVGILYSIARAEKGVSSIRGAATAAFRNAENRAGYKFIEKARSCYKGLDVKVVTIEEEGELEFRGVVAFLLSKGHTRKAEKLLKSGSYPAVWGLGSTSSQITFWDRYSKSNDFYVADAGPGSDTFCNIVIRAKKGPDAICGPDEMESINPIWPDKANPPKTIVNEYNVVKQQLHGKQKIWPKELLRSIAEFGVAPFVIGKPIIFMISDKDVPFSKAELDVELEKKRTLSKVDHYSTATNMVIADAVMSAYNIVKVEKVAGASLAHGLLVSGDW